MISVGKKRGVFWFFQLTVSLALILYLVFLIEIDQLRSALGNVQLFPILFAPLVILFSFTFAAYRWKILLVGLGIQQRLPQLYLYYIIGSFYSMILPGSVSGDIVRTAYCSLSAKTSPGYVAASTLLERFCGLFFLLCMACGIMLFTPVFPPLPQDFTYLESLPIILLCCFLFIGCCFIAIRFYLQNVKMEEMPTDWRNPIIRFAWLIVRIPPEKLSLLLIFTGLFQITTIIADYCIAVSLNISVSFLFYLAVASITFIISAIPISLGGLGVREGMFVLFLSLASVSSSDAILFSFLIYCNRLIAGSLGPIVQIYIKFQHHS